ncbi:MAG: hypothetical protein ACE14O_06460 [Candidatus Cloacimonadaceae bacterium]
MKHPKWFLIIVFILLIINVTFFILWYTLDGQGKVKSKLEQYLSQQLHGSLTIEKLAVNERHITANNISFRDDKNTVYVKAAQVQINYNLFKIITSGFKLNSVIREIIVYEPAAKIVYIYKPQKEKKAFKIPDLTPYFRTLTVKNGKADFTFATQLGSFFADSLKYNEQFNNITISAVNKNKTNAILQTETSNHGNVKLKVTMNKGNISLIDIMLEQYRPRSIYLSGCQNLDSEISVLLKYRKKEPSAQPTISFNSILWNTSIQKDKYKLQLPYMQIEGNQNITHFNISESLLNDNRFRATGSLSDILKEPAINSQIILSQLSLSDISPELNGTAEGIVNLNGKVSSLTASGHITVPELNVKQERITDIKVTAEYNGKEVNFTTQPFSWRQETSSLAGVYDLDNRQMDISLATAPTSEKAELRVKSDLSANLNFVQGLKATVNLRTLDAASAEINLSGLHGYAIINLPNFSIENLNLDIDLSDGKGFAVRSQGGLKNSNLVTAATLTDFNLQEYWLKAEEKGIDLITSGKVNVLYSDDKLSGSAELKINLISPDSIKGDFISAFSYDPAQKNAELSLMTENSQAAGMPFELSLKADYDGKYIHVNNFNLDDKLVVSGWTNISDYFDSGFSLYTDSLDFAKYWTMFVPGKNKLPLNAELSADLDYNLNRDKQVTGFLTINPVQLAQLHPMNLNLNFSGTSDSTLINTGISYSNTNINIQGLLVRQPELNLKANAVLKRFNLAEIVPKEMLKGWISGDVNLNFTLPRQGKPHTELGCNISGERTALFEIPFDAVNIKAAQLDEVLQVDSLYISNKKLATLSAQGGLDYNFFSGNSYEGTDSLNLTLTGDPLRILHHFVPFVQATKSNLVADMTIRTGEEGIIVKRGKINLSDGTFKLKSQDDVFSNLEINAVIRDNVLHLEKFTCEEGAGKLYIRNDIDPNEDNFFLGPINLGYFLIHTNDNGLKIYIPGYLPANTVATGIIKGQGTREAYIKGPFDDMKIKAEIIASNGSVVYPANTKNLLQLINLFGKKEQTEALPLPFTLDLLIDVGDNIRYVTYPADLTCQPGGFLRITYDGNNWYAEEANFASEKGTVDFYGTIFEVKNAVLVINSKSNVFSINGVFTKKAADGTLITLQVLTNPQKGGNVLNQLEFSLTSDNPEDKTITQILSRLRYNRNLDELNPDQRQALLQDEAMQLISTSVSTTYVSQFLSPIENKIRRFLGLDSFSITTGFVQNLFVEFTSGNQFNDANISNLNTEILQFSSSVFLNNLSVSMGKYLGHSVYLDYEIYLQETTDLAKQTKLDMYHNASVRFNLPWNFKFIYTFSLRPKHEENAHEVMVKRSFRF